MIESQSIIHHQSTIHHPSSVINPTPPKAVIWIVNPFDQLPNEADVPLRYWALCRTFAEQGHNVIWWSSDFSHLTKSKRQPCPDTNGFSVRLIETPPYTKNISFARLRNHKAFAKVFYRDAMTGLKSGRLLAPDRIVVSLPPLGIAESAFKIRDHVNRSAQLQQANQLNTKSPHLPHQSSTITHSSSQHDCQVVVDIMDAWPEVFYQVLPTSLRTIASPRLFWLMHRSAKRAYQGTDKISAVGQSYLELASRYLGQKTESRRQRADRSFAINHQSSSAKPMHLCYHGTDLDRFQQSRSEKVKRETCESKATLPSTYSHPSALIRQHSSLNKPLKAVYLGAMGTGYDLQTIIDVAARWKAENDFPVQIHFAGTGPQRETLEARATEFGLISHQSSSINHQSSSAQADLHQSSVINDSERIIFHGQLGRDAVNHLLSSADLAFVPNRSSSFVACPYKAGEYAAAGLPMLSCLRGELGRLLRKWNAGSEYNEGDAASLQATFEKYLTDLDLLKQQSLNAQEMAEALFDRKRTYPVLADFILH